MHCAESADNARSSSSAPPALESIQPRQVTNSLASLCVLHTHKPAPLHPALVVDLHLTSCLALQPCHIARPSQPSASRSYRAKITATRGSIAASAFSDPRLDCNSACVKSYQRIETRAGATSNLHLHHRGRMVRSNFIVGVLDRPPSLGR